MLFRLNVYRLVLKVAIYLLPSAAFEIGWQTWAFSMELLGRPVLYSTHGHFTLIMCSSFVWAFIAEHYDVTIFETSSFEKERAPRPLGPPPWRRLSF